jgi:uncharacterized protein YdeI (YjbR/CyaY-like superfamily)
MAEESPTFFRTPAEFRRWLRRNYATARELWVGYYKKATGRASITWAESVDEALCFGWIDGIRKAHDAISYKVRFTPRRKTSIWSAVNIANVKRLLADGRMQPSGMEAFAARREYRSGIYSYENRPSDLPPPLRKLLGRNAPAAAFFRNQPPGYRRRVVWWIVSARTDATQQKRLALLIEASAAGKRIE